MYAGYATYLTNAQLYFASGVYNFPNSTDELLLPAGSQAILIDSSQIHERSDCLNFFQREDVPSRFEIILLIIFGCHAVPAYHLTSC